MAVSVFIAGMIRLLQESPEVTAAYLRLLPESGAAPDLHLYVIAAPDWAARAGEWLDPLNEAALVDRRPEGWLLVSPEGEVVVITPVVTPPAAPHRPLFDRRRPGASAPAMPQAAEPRPADPSREAACFWGDLYLALRAIGQNWSLTAHGDLERCRLRLVNLYRLALSPAEPGDGWAGVEGLEGADALTGLVQWLVAPLDGRSQWRCAHRLAAAYESLTLPLVERLGLPYPWAMRNLAFKRLDETRPDRGPAPPAGVETLRDLADRPDPVAPAGPARFRIKRRGPT